MQIFARVNPKPVRASLSETNPTIRVTSLLAEMTLSARLTFSEGGRSIFYTLPSLCVIKRRYIKLCIPDMGTTLPESKAKSWYCTGAEKRPTCKGLWETDEVCPKDQCAIVYEDERLGAL